MSSERLSLEERNLLYAYVQHKNGHYENADELNAEEMDDVDAFVAAFDADPRTNRAEIAPARDPMMSDEELHGGSDGNR